MLDLERVKRDDRLLRALTGLNLKALAALQPSFAQALAEAPIPRRSQQPRERSVGGGHKPRLASVEDKLIYILFYVKCYPTFDLAGLLFDHQVYRNRIEGFDDRSMVTAAGPWNFYLEAA